MLFLVALLVLLLVLLAGVVVLPSKRVEVWLLHTRLNGSQFQRRRLQSQRACLGGLSHDWEFN
jgi:hypothetical protein